MVDIARYRLPEKAYTSEQYVDKSKKFYLLLDKMSFDGYKCGDLYRATTGELPGFYKTNPKIQT